MVYSERETSTVTTSNLTWVWGIPFSAVPRELVEALKGRSFSYGDFLEWGVLLEKNPLIWTLGLVDGNKEIKIFAT